MNQNDTRSTSDYAEPESTKYSDEVLSLIKIGNDPSADIRLRTFAHFTLRKMKYPNQAAKIADVLAKDLEVSTRYKFFACITLAKTNHIKESLEKLLEISTGEENELRLRLLAAKKLWLFSLPGSVEVGKRAHILSAHHQDKNGKKWLVYGGTDPHNVTVDLNTDSDSINYTYRCDCIAYKDAGRVIANYTCSHVALVRYKFELAAFHNASPMEKILGWLNFALPRLETKIARGDAPFEKIAYNPEEGPFLTEPIDLLKQQAIKSKIASALHIATTNFADIGSCRQALDTLKDLNRKDLVLKLAQNHELPVEVRLCALSRVVEDVYPKQLNLLVLDMFSNSDPESPLIRNILFDLFQSGQKSLAIRACLSRNILNEQDAYKTASLCLDLFGASSEMMEEVKHVAYSDDSILPQKVSAIAVLVMLKQKTEAADLLFDLCRIPVGVTFTAINKIPLAILNHLERFDLLYHILVDITINISIRQSAIEILGQRQEFDLLLNVANNESSDASLRVWALGIIIEKGFLSNEALPLLLNLLYDVSNPSHVTCEIAKRIGHAASTLTYQQGLSVAKYITDLDIHQKDEKAIFNHFIWGFKNAEWLNRNAVIWIKPLVEGKFETKKVSQELRDRMWEVLSELYMQTEELIYKSDVA